MKNIFTDQEFMSSPFGKADQLREQASLVKVRLPIIGKVWITTTQKATGLILKDTQNFTLRKGDGNVTGVGWWMPKSIKLLANNMLTMDEPDHMRLRQLVDHAFRRDVILALQPRIELIAKELAERLFEDGDEADLITRFARHLPLAVICELLGLPKSDHKKFSKWAEGFTSVEGIFDFFKILSPINKMRKYLIEEIDRQRFAPKQGLIGELTAMQNDRADISDDELIAMIFLLLLAGHETTTHVISGGVFTLLQHRKQLDLMLENDDALSLGTEELLRHVSAVQFTKPRNVKKDIVVEGIALKKGDVVMAMIVAANGDPQANKCPHDFDTTRKPNKHVAFGAGPHFCLGHQLARLEISCAIKVLFSTHPNLKLAVNADSVKWRSRVGLRVLDSLPVNAQ